VCFKLVNYQEEHFAVNARLSPDYDMKGLDLFFCVRVMGAVCALVLMSFLSLFECTLFLYN